MLFSLQINENHLLLDNMVLDYVIARLVLTPTLMHTRTHSFIH